jgi:transcriptional regulator with XRE-family HTH domain
VVLLRRQPNDEGPLPDEEAYHGAAVDIDSADYRAWARIGRLLYQGRKSRQISKREAARRAGISEALWRLLEDGGRDVNAQWVLPHPRPENLLAATLAVGMDPQIVFEEADLQLPSTFAGEMHDDRLAHKITHLSERDRTLVERLVDSMLAVAEPPPPGATSDLAPSGPGRQGYARHGSLTPSGSLDSHPPPHSASQDLEGELRSHTMSEPTGSSSTDSANHT